MAFVITIDDPDSEDVRELVRTHLEFARSVTPPGHVHAMEATSLKDPAITFYSARDDGQLLGVAALRRLDASDIELKSMHTVEAARGRGVGEAIVRHLLEDAALQGYERLYLETGTMEAFAPARRLYERIGFRACAPFGDYTVNPHSTCMRITLPAAAGSGPLELPLRPEDDP